MASAQRVTVIGWDIGGVNTKVARVEDGRVRAVIGRPFEIQLAPSALRDVLRELADEVGASPDARHAVTMTAELSQAFRTKREGVSFVLDAVVAAFPSSSIQVYAVDGRFLSITQARREPLVVAAANWAATARVVAWSHPDCLLVDIGTTTTDIVPIVGGEVAAQGWTDPDRLAAGELVYTGALRTPVEAMVGHVPYGNGHSGVSAEGFALAGDVHVSRGDLAPADYTVTPPDRRPPTREFAAERLARAICADREMLDEVGVSRIAEALAVAQVAQVADAIRRVCAPHPGLRTAVVTGLGAFIGARAARAAGLIVVELGRTLGEAAGRCAPAASVALLLDAQLAVSEPARGRGGEVRAHTPRTASGDARAGDLRGVSKHIDLVVKIGGGLLADLACLDGVLSALAKGAHASRLLVVPGGGPFADAVRDADRAVGLSDDAAHWMAILAMDQYAHLLADRLPAATVVSSAHEAGDVLDARRIPILAPARWLRSADPLPHAWEVTSDSIAAWVAGEVGASRLVLVKPSGADGSRLVDEHFDATLPRGVSAVVVPGDRLEMLSSALLGL